MAKIIKIKQENIGKVARKAGFPVDRFGQSLIDGRPISIKGLPYLAGRVWTSPLVSWRIVAKYRGLGQGYYILS